MLTTKKLDLTTCATCKAPVSLVQINRKTIAVEPAAGWIGGSLIVLEIHRCHNPEVPASDRRKGSRR
jgi:hypothetical protein